MKILLIGGTGTISTAISEKLNAEGHDLWILNRGHRNNILSRNTHCIVADINDEKTIASAVGDHYFDSVADFIAYKPSDIERDFRLFAGKTNQYIFISSASAYQKPPQSYLVNENTPLENPFWEYSRNKIACEKTLARLGIEHRFPYTIVRPSHTYDNRKVPTGVHGAKGSWQVVRRIIEGKPIIIHGDGASLWTMTHASDFANAFVPLIGNPLAIDEAVQITSNETLTWNQIYEAIAEAVGRPLIPFHVASDLLAKAGAHYDLQGSLLGDKAVSVVFDNSKLRRLVPDFTPLVTFKTGVKNTIENILAHPELQTEDKEFDRWCDEIIR